MFYRVLNTPLLWNFITFIIKPNPNCANNNPKLQTFFKILYLFFQFVFKFTSFNYTDERHLKHIQGWSLKTKN